MSIVRSFFATGCVIALLLTGIHPIPAPPAPQAAPIAIAAKFQKSDRERLIEAKVNHKTEVMLVIASVPGSNEAVARQIANLGGVVRYRDDDVDYLRAKVPTDRAATIARLPGVYSISVDGEPQYRYSHVLDAPSANPSNNAAQAVRSLRNRSMPPENPYLPVRDLGAPQFIAAHKTFDGRGATIAVIDGFPDLLTPELQAALTLDGKPTRKIVEILDATDPLDDDNPYRVRMRDQVLVSGGRFIHKGLSYTFNVDGQYRLGFFDERAVTYPYLKSDANRDGNPPGSSGLFAVLWDETKDTVWVDTNQNRSFADEKAMSDYNAHFDVGVFGRDNPSTPVRETCAFTVHVDSKNRLVFINLAAHRHSTAVGGVAAGNRLLGGKLNGVAPSAQLIFINIPPLVHGAIEGMILAAKRREVDLITIQLSSRNRLNDGASTVSVIWDRLAERYKKLIFVSAGNFGPGVNTVGELSAGNRVMSVGGYIHKDTWRSNYRVDAGRLDNVMDASVRGPSEDGGFKPDIVAPMAAIISDPMMYDAELADGGPELPPGYSSGAGTSISAPMAAGCAALLMSAARQSDIAADAERVRWALRSSARFLSSYGAYEQGSGIVNVPAAWEALKRAPAPIGITSNAPVNTVLSRYLRQPHQGRGIYEREGWTAGQIEQRTISLMRTTGEAGPITFVARWVGDDGTFSSPAKISLPLNMPVVLPVTVNPKSPGIHSAILNLDDLSGNHSVHQVMNTVIAAEQFTFDKGFEITREGQAEYPGKASYFFNVPVGARACKFELNIANGSSNLRLRFIDPSGKELDFSRPRTTWSPYQTDGRIDRVIVRPDPGVWEMIIDNGNIELKGYRSSALLATRFKLRAVALGVEAISSTLAIEKLQSSEDREQEVGFINRLGAFTGGVVDSTLGSAFSDRPAITASDEQQFYDIDVPAGSSSLNAQVGAVSDSEADLDLYLYDCTGQECVLQDYSIGAGATERITVTEPAGGKWRVVIDPVSVPSGRTSYDYLDVFTHSAFGRIESGDAPGARGSGAGWIGRLRIKINATPTSGRRLACVVEVASDKTYVVEYLYNLRTYRGDVVRRRVTLGTIE